MTQKKNLRFTLERKRFQFFQIGLVLATALTLTAFEWQTFSFEKHYEESLGCPGWIEQEEPPITPLPPPDNMPKPEHQSDDEIEVIDDDSDDQESQEPNLKMDIVDSDSFNNNEGYVGDTNIVDPPPPPLNKYDVDAAPYLCECEHLTTANEREVCTNETLFKFLAKTMNVPEVWMDIGGTKEVVSTRFVVEANGQISSIEIARSDLIHPALVAEAQRGISLLPCFLPGKVDDKPVAVYISLPITFKVK